MIATTEGAVLDVRGVTVRFGGNIALRDVGLTAAPGAVTGLIGPNGAGKTTLFNVICGLQKPDQGSVRIGDRDVTRLLPYRRARAGLARTFQRLELFTLLSVRSNVRIAAVADRRNRRDRSVDPDRVADEVLERVGLSGVADARVDELPTGQARLVEVGRALAARPRVLLLDEPAAGVNPALVDAIAERILALHRSGVTILLIEHNLDFVMRLCRPVLVMASGKLLLEAEPETVRSDARVIEAYLGGPGR